jgi:MGT family glycosyltransferase
MTRRYLLALVDGGGNVPPELHAVGRLAERGHDVCVIADDSVAADVDTAGATRRRWQRAPNRADRRPEHDPMRDWECRTPWQLIDRMISTQLVGPAAAYAADTDAAIAKFKPDRVLCSMFCTGAMIAAEAQRIPFDVLFATVYPLPAEGLPPFGIGLAPATNLLGRIRDRTLNALADRFWDAKGLAGLNAVRQQWRLPPLSHVFDQVHRARRQLVFTAAAFDFPAQLPSNVRYVGPVLDDPVWAATASWTPPAGTDPLVLVALSSTFQDQVPSLQRVIDALSEMRVRAVVTTGPAIDPDALRAPANVTVVVRAPHSEILHQADVVITHGGHGTVMKTLAAGVPMVLLPHGRDQADTAVRVTLRGAGLALKRSSTSRVIAGAVRAVLQLRAFRTAAQELGEAVRREADSDLLVRELEATSVDGVDDALELQAAPSAVRGCNGKPS